MRVKVAARANCSLTIDAITKVPEVTTTIPPAPPSRLSIRLREFVIPTIQIIETTTFKNLIVVGCPYQLISINTIANMVAETL